MAIIAAALEAYDFGWLDGRTLVDVAGGHGMVRTEILKKHPGTKGVVFDLEHVVVGALPRIEAQGLSERCEIAHGDFFQAVPGADGYVMKNIIHDWNDERSATILKNIHRAARPGSRVVLLEAVIAPGNDPHLGKWIDLEMLLLPGGKERTEREYRDLFAETGFRMTKVIPTQSSLSVVEAIRVD